MNGPLGFDRLMINTDLEEHGELLVLARAYSEHVQSVRLVATEDGACILERFTLLAFELQRNASIHVRDAEYNYTSCIYCIVCDGSFTLLDTDSGTDSDSDSKPNGYIVLYSTCSHYPHSQIIIQIWIPDHYCAHFQDRYICIWIQI